MIVTLRNAVVASASSISGRYDQCLQRHDERFGSSIWCPPADADPIPQGIGPTIERVPILTPISRIVPTPHPRKMLLADIKDAGGAADRLGTNLFTPCDLGDSALRWQS